MMHFMPVRMVIMTEVIRRLSCCNKKRTEDSKQVSEDVEKLGSPILECKIMQQVCKQMAGSLNFQIPYDPTILPLDIAPRDAKNTCMPQNAHTTVHNSVCNRQMLTGWQMNKWLGPKNGVLFIHKKK